VLGRDARLLACGFGVGYEDSATRAGLRSGSGGEHVVSWAAERAEPPRGGVEGPGRGLSGFGGGAGGLLESGELVKAVGDGAVVGLGCGEFRLVVSQATTGRAIRWEPSSLRLLIDVMNSSFVGRLAGRRGPTAAVSLAAVPGRSRVVSVG
jgi:hypothetical protein